MLFGQDSDAFLQLLNASDQWLELASQPSGHKAVGIIPMSLGADRHGGGDAPKPLFQSGGLAAALAQEELAHMVKASLLQRTKRGKFQDKIGCQRGGGVLSQQLQRQWIIKLEQTGHLISQGRTLVDQITPVAG